MTTKTTKPPKPKQQAVAMRHPPKFEDYIDMFTILFSKDTVELLFGHGKEGEFIGRLYLSPKGFFMFARMVEEAKATYTDFLAGKPIDPALVQLPEPNPSSRSPFTV